MAPSAASSAPLCSISSVRVRKVKDFAFEEFAQPASLSLSRSSAEASSPFVLLLKFPDQELTIPVSQSVEYATIGERTVCIGRGSSAEAVAVSVDGNEDFKQLVDCLGGIKSGKTQSMFEQRTEETSAVQYFQFYSFLSQQQNMLQDYIRTATYQRAIQMNDVDFRDKVVMDVGAGSGILSFFACQVGAKRVYAVEASSMAEHCQALARFNRMDNVVKVIHGKVEEISVPEQVDIIISEPMGYMLLNERMLESFLHAKKFLKPGGKMFPTVGDLHVAPFTDESLYMEQLSKANFWYQTAFHGIDLSGLREKAFEEYFRQPIVDTFDIRICPSTSVKWTVNFEKDKETDLYNIDIPLNFTLTTTGMVHGLAFWFDAAFIGSQATVWLTTAPNQPLTHWYQVRCLLKTPLFGMKGQVMTGRVLMVANGRQSYDVTIDLAIESTGARSTNTLDLKNPYFRYNGQAVEPPPGINSTSPSDNYNNQVQQQFQNMQVGSAQPYYNVNAPNGPAAGYYGANLAYGDQPMGYQVPPTAALPQRPIVASSSASPAYVAGMPATAAKYVAPHGPAFGH